MDNIFHFINNYLIPSLHSGGMATAFPNINFVKRGNKWGAKNYLNGQPHRERWDKIWTSSDSSANCKPHLIKEQGGDSISLIKFYQNLTGASFIEAVKALSSSCGLTPPEPKNSESYRAFIEKQEKLESIALRMMEALHSDKGRAVLQYLKGKRAYSDDFIEFAEFGYCSPDTAKELRSILYEGEDNPTYFSNSIGIDNILSLPYRTGGKIQGFVFRRIDGVESKKYCDVFISQKATKSYNLFGLSGLPLTGNADQDRDVVVVEGEIDCLRALHSGIKNVVAASGGVVTEEALKEAKRKGVLRVTILFDSESNDTAQEETDKKIEKAISTIRKVGLEPFVASFGIWENTTDGSRIKMDTDSYLQNHSGEELQHLIRYSAENGSLWQYFRILNKFKLIEEADGEERLAETDFSEFRREVIQLCKKIPQRTDRERIYSEFSRITHGVLSEEVMREEAEEDLQEQRRLQALSEAKKIAQEVISLTEQNKMEEATALGKKLSDLNDISREAEYSSLLSPLSLSKVKDTYLNKPKGIHTGYYFGDNGSQVELIIQAAALTYICAPTSHGKTTFLQNLSLRTAKSEDRDGDVIFITFEEAVDDITTEFLTLYIGEHLSANTLRSIRSYYSGEGNYFRGEEKLRLFQSKEAEFDKLLTSGKLRIYRRPNQISDLSGLITYLNKTLKIKAVFVDYVQRIKNRDIRGTKKDVIEAVCDELMNVSLATGLPIVLGAQLNRQAYSPLEMENQNIADASDIEHSANTIVLLWNSDTKPLAQSTKYFTDGKREKFSPEAQKIESMGFNIGTSGKLYALLSKNRGAQRNLSAVFSFNGGIRVISQLYPSIPEKTPDQPESSESLFPFPPQSGEDIVEF